MGTKKDSLTKVFDLPEEGKENNQLMTKENTLPDEFKASLKKNKKELNEIYIHSKQLLLNLIDDAKDIGRPRDIEVISDFMKNVTGVLKDIKDVDKDIIGVNKIGDDDETGKKINNYIFTGDSRDLANLMKSVKDKKEDIVDAEITEVKE